MSTDTILFERTEDGRTYQIIEGDVRFALLPELFTIRISGEGFDLTGFRTLEEAKSYIKRRIAFRKRNVLSALSTS